MNIQLNENQTKHLLFALTLYDYVANSPHEEEDPGVNEFVQTMLKQLVTQGQKKWVEDTDSGLGVTEDAYAELFSSYIDPYEDHLFWSDLSSELAKRDLELSEPNVDFESLPESVYEGKIAKLIDQYDKEFEQNGLDRLFLKK